MPVTTIPYATVNAVGSTSGPTTASATPADLAEMTVTLTTRGGNLDCRFDGGFLHTTAAQTITISLILDAGGATATRTIPAPLAGGTYQITLSHLYTGVAAGPHTVKVQWSTSAATATAVATSRELIVREAA